MAVDPAILRQLLAESGLKYEQNSVSYIFTCPRCSGKRKLYIRKRDGRFVCWVCKETDNYQGRPEFALADLLGTSSRVLHQRLYGGLAVPVSVYLDVHLTDYFGDDEEEEGAAEISTVAWPLDYFPIEDETSKKGADYLAGRGIPLVLARQYGIRYAPEKRRVVFPVSKENDLYGWQERTIIPNTWIDENGVEREFPKILSSTGIPRDRTLMFVDRLKGYDHAVLCEGPVDALKAHACGGNVCAMGKAVTSQQMSLLLNGGVKRIYLALDPDAADETERLVRTHFDDVELYQMQAVGEGKADLGAMSIEAVYDLFLSARRIRAGQLFFFLDQRLS